MFGFFMDIGGDDEAVLGICEVDLLRGYKNAGERLLVLPEFRVNKLGSRTSDSLLAERPDCVKDDSLM